MRKRKKNMRGREKIGTVENKKKEKTIGRG